MMMPGRDLENGKAELGSSIEEALVIFCVDTSGSMCVTTPVPGRLHLRGHDELEHRRRLNINEDITNQYAPRERRDITYVSRLQSMQAAVDQQLTNLARSHPSQRVALITFSDEVVVIGDGRSGDMIVAGDRLANPDALTQIGAQLPLPSSIRESREILSRRVFSLEDSGQTALGPALLLSILLATRTPGSRVIICTDGLANKGIGSLDDLKTDEEFASSQVFYKDLGDIAMENGVTVSLVTIKGTECRVLELGRVADRTGGTVNVVDPLTITTEFSNILANPIIATNVVAKIVLPQQMYFCRESTPKSVLTVPVGNVTADSEISYEYDFLGTKKPTEYIPEKATSGNLQLPFQVQIDYTTCDGSRYLKVITKHHCVTKNRKEAESAMNFTVIGAHAARETASLAAEGKFAEARGSAESSSSLLQKSSLRNEQERTQYRTLMENMEHLSDALPVVTHTKGGARLPISWEDDSEEESVCAESYISSFGSAVPGRIQSSPRQKTVCLARPNLVRQREISDQLACEILHARTSTDSAITSCSSWH